RHFGKTRQNRRLRGSGAVRIFLIVTQGVKIQTDLLLTERTGAIRTRSEFVPRVHALEAGGLVAGGQLSATQTDNCESFGNAHARPVPPIARDGSTGQKVDALVAGLFVDVQMALQDRQNVVILESN